MKRIVAFLLAFTLLAAGCAGMVFAGEAEAPAAEESEEELKVMMQKEPDYMSPASGFNQYCATEMFTMFEPLIKNIDGNLEPCLAQEWEWVDDLHLAVTLRDNVYFHNGEKLKSSDVVYSFKTSAQGEAATYYEKFDLEDFEIIDDLHLVIAFVSPCPYFTEVTGNYLIYSEKGIEDLGGVQAASAGGAFGTGPYVFTEWSSGQYIKVTRYDNYWDADSINYYKDIVFTFNEEAAQRAMSLESGAVDVVAEIATTSVSELEGIDGITLVEGPTSLLFTFIMNNAAPPFDDARVREAVYLLLDPYAVLAVAAENRGVVIDTMWSPDLSVYSQPAGIENRAVNVERAKELLAEAGYENGLDITIMNQVPFQTINEVIQSNLAAGGINATLNTLDLGAYFEAYASGSYQCYAGIIDQMDMNLALDKLDGRVGPAKASGGIVASFPELEELIDIAKMEVDEAKRLQAYADIQQYLFDNHNVVGIFARSSYYGMKSGLTGIVYNEGPRHLRVEEAHPIGK